MEVEELGKAKQGNTVNSSNSVGQRSQSPISLTSNMNSVEKSQWGLK